MADSLAERLATIHDLEPRRARRELASACTEALGGGTGVFMRQQPDDEGCIRYADIICAGPLRFMEDMEGAEVYAGSAHDPTEQAMRSRRDRWSLRTPARRHTNRFSTLRQDVDPAHLDDLPVMRDIYTPAGIIDQARMFVVDRGRVIGWFGVWTTGRDGRFDRRRLALLNEAAPAITSALISVDAVDRWDTEGSVAVVRADGRIDATTPDVAAWLDADRQALLATRIREIDRGTRATVIAVERALARVTRLDGPDGVRYLLTFTARALRVSPVSVLTPRQRDVADLAALGFTVDEVADQLAISSNTVKTHLRHIYDVLNVANRVELADVLRDT